MFDLPVPSFQKRSGYSTSLLHHKTCTILPGCVCSLHCLLLEEGLPMGVAGGAFLNKGTDTMELMVEILP